MKHPIVYLLLLTILISCGTSNEHTGNEKASSLSSKNLKTEDTAKAAIDSINTESSVDFKSSNIEPNSINNEFNNITAIISGMTGKANNLNYLFDSAAWLNHSKFIDSSWQKLEKRRLNSMNKWAVKEFKAVNENTTTVFYPFSGPDFLTANAFFPNSSKYIMLGLEPVGKLPELKKFKGTDANDYANDFQSSLRDIFDKSYFITKNMLHDFGSQKVNGLLPIMTFFIRKSGYDITNIEYFYRYHQDSIKLRKYSYKETERKPFGVKINFTKNGTNKEVYYFKYDVSDKSFNDTCVFYNLINEQTKNSITYIKGASYLLHANFMSNMRKLILKNSLAVIQDDTGIPFKYYQDGNNFNIKVYGEYTKPVKDFPYLSMQKPLEEFFHKDSANIGKLPFHLGYHWQSKKDVIIYALKK